MAYITWQEKYSVKNKCIDEQHIKLIDMINEFYDELKNKSNNDLIKGLVAKMKLYAQVHFSTEEKLFKIHNVPNIRDHISEHNNFIKKVSELEMKLENGSMILSFEITNFLKKWLLDHILCTDMQYVDYLKD